MRIKGRKTRPKSRRNYTAGIAVGEMIFLRHKKGGAGREGRGVLRLA